MNLDLTDSPSRTQKSTTQKKSYKPRKSNTKNTRKSNFSIHFPPPKASHKLSSKKKKKSCNQSISQPKIIRAPPSPLQAGKITNANHTGDNLWRIFMCLFNCVLHFLPQLSLPRKLKFYIFFSFLAFS